MPELAQPAIWQDIQFCKKAALVVAEPAAAGHLPGDQAGAGGWALQLHHCSSIWTCCR
jgi:hypothetical protein